MVTRLRSIPIAVATFVTVTAFAVPSLGAKHASRFHVVDVMPDFWRFVARGKGATSAERRALFEKTLVARHPTVIVPAVVGEGDPDRYWTMLQPSLPRIREIERQLNRLLMQGERTFRRQLPDFELRQAVYVTPSFLNFDGATRTVGGETAILFGVDGMAHLHPPHRRFEPLVLHELFHAYHRFDDDGTFMSALWREGLATYASRVLRPDSTEADVLLSEQLADVGPSELARLAGEVLERLDSRVQGDRDRFFSADSGGDEDPRRGVPLRCGYLVGYRVAEALGQRFDLQALARLRHAELKPLIRSALLTLARSPTEPSQSSWTAILVEERSPAVAEGQLVEHIGIETLGGVFTPLLSRGQTVPCETTQTFGTAGDNQDSIQLRLFRGIASLARDATPLGTFTVENLPRRKRGEVNVHVTISVDAVRRIRLTVRERSGTAVTIRRSVGIQSRKHDFARPHRFGPTLTQSTKVCW